MSDESENSHEPLVSNQKQTDLEVKDDGPDETKGQLGVAVGDVIITDVHQLDLKTQRPLGIRVLVCLFGYI